MASHKSELLCQVELEMARVCTEDPKGAAEYASWWERMGSLWSRYAVSTGNGYGSAASAYAKAAQFYRTLGDAEKADDCLYWQGNAARGFEREFNRKAA